MTFLTRGYSVWSIVNNSAKDSFHKTLAGIVESLTEHTNLEYGQRSSLGWLVAFCFPAHHAPQSPFRPIPRTRQHRVQLIPAIIHVHSCVLQRYVVSAAVGMNNPRLDYRFCNCLIPGLLSSRRQVGPQHPRETSTSF